MRADPPALVPPSSPAARYAERARAAAAAARLSSRSADARAKGYFDDPFGMEDDDEDVDARDWGTPAEVMGNFWIS